MTGKRYSVNMKPAKKKPTQKKQSDNTASSGQVHNATTSEKPLTGHSMVNCESSHHHDGGIPPALSENQPADPVLHHLREQDKQIDRLSNTVDELRKTMGEMNDSLVKLQEENQRNPPPPSDVSSGDKFDIVASVLKELRAKDDKVERLKLENDVLVLKLRYLGEKHSDNSTGDDCVDRSMGETIAKSVKVPLKEPDEGAASEAAPTSTRDRHQCPEVQISIPAAQNKRTKRRSTSNAGTGTSTTEKEQPSTKPPAKKPRRSSTKASVPSNPTPEQQEPAGRGRPLSGSQDPKTTIEPQTTEDTNGKNGHAAQPSLPLRHVAPSSSTSNLSTASTAKETDNPDPNTTGEPGTLHRRRSTRSLTRRSRRPSLSPSSQAVIPPSDGSTGDAPSFNELSQKEAQDEQERLRKEQIAARDRLVEFAMQREEAMDMTEGAGLDNQV